MCNVNELKECRIVKCNNHYYFVGYTGNKWYDANSGSVDFIDDSTYELVSVAYKTLNDFKNDKPFYNRNNDLLSEATKEWLRYVVRSLKNVNFETLELEVCDSYCSINFRTNNGYYDGIVLPDYDFIIHDFSKLEIGKIYTFKELGIKL